MFYTEHPLILGDTVKNLVSPGDLAIGFCAPLPYMHEGPCV